MKVFGFLYVCMGMALCTFMMAKEKPLSVDGPRIAWDHSSFSVIDGHGGCYPRIIRLDDGTHMAAYETAGTVAVRKSLDGGVSWGDKQVVISHYKAGSVRVNAANAEICQLSDGTLLCGANFRPSADGTAPWSIAVARSSDGGLSWTLPEIVYKADVYAVNGCWEPYFLELPDGKVHLYFANEGPYTNSEEQEISCLVSEDGGRTWGTDALTVSFRGGHRDGMPVARVFGDEIVVAIEDNVYGEFVPFTVRCGLSDAWQEPVLSESECRAQALVEDIQDGKVYGGAPYLLKLPSGEAVMSYQRAYGDRWDMSTMEVVIGDKEAREFARPSYPFEVHDGEQCLWNSLCMMDDVTIGAVGSLTVDGRTLPVMKKGRVIADVKAQGRDVQELPIFIGSKSDSHVGAGVGQTGKELVFRMKVSDMDVYVGVEACSDGIYLYADPVGSEVLSEGAWRIWCSPFGKAVMYGWRNGSWKRLCRLSMSTELTDDGYELVLAVPKSRLKGLDEDGVRLGMTFFNYSPDGEGYEEDLVDMVRNTPCTWLPVEL